MVTPADASSANKVLYFYELILFLEHDVNGVPLSVFGIITSNVLLLLLQLHSTTSASSMLSSSPGFVRPSRGATSTSIFLLLVNNSC